MAISVPQNEQLDTDATASIGLKKNKAINPNQTKGFGRVQVSKSSILSKRGRLEQEHDMGSPSFTLKRIPESRRANNQNLPGRT